MDFRQQRKNQALRRSRDWLRAHSDVVTAPALSPVVATQIDELDAIIVRLAEAAQSQVVQESQATLISRDEKTQRVEILTHHIRPMVGIAKVLVGTVPGIGVLKVPKANTQSEPLVIAAGALVEQAKVFEPVLLEHGLPKTALAELGAATVALKASIDARGRARAQRVGATKSINADLRLGFRVLALIDASVSRLLRGQTRLMAEWSNAKRVTVKPAPVRMDPTPEPRVA